MNQLHVYQTRTSTKFHTFTGPPVATPRQVLYGIFETAPHASIEQLGLILSRAAGHSSWLDADIPVDFSALLASDRIFVNPIVKPMFIHFPDGPSQELVVDQRQPLQDVLGCLGWFSAFAPIGNRRSALNLWRSAGEQTDASELFLTRIYAQPSSGPQHHVEQSPGINVGVGDSRKQDAQINIDDTLSAIETVLTEALKSEMPDRHVRRSGTSCHGMTCYVN
jgi:hypothetical protein